LHSEVVGGVGSVVGYDSLVSGNSFGLGGSHGGDSSFVFGNSVGMSSMSGGVSLSSVLLSGMSSLSFFVGMSFFSLGIVMSLLGLLMSVVLLVLDVRHVFKVSLGSMLGSEGKLNFMEVVVVDSDVSSSFEAVVSVVESLLSISLVALSNFVFFMSVSKLGSFLGRVGFGILVVGSSFNVVGLGGFVLSHLLLEVSGEFSTDLSEDSSLLFGGEVGHGVVLSGFNEFDVLSDELLSSLLSFFELLLVLEEGKVSEFSVRDSRFFFS
jgi:hypothetical protein